MIKRILFFGLCSWLAFSCQSGDKETTEPADNLVGSWDAKWVVVSEEVLSSLPETVIPEMKGEITFYADQEAIITGYGYAGCLFAQDTITNKLSWKLEDQRVQLFNEQDSFTMEYKIILLDDDTASFNFLDDFNILLRKDG